MSDLEIKYGWVCPICRSVNSSYQEAESCLNNHEEYTIEQHRVLSSPWPINIRIWKEVAGKRVEWKDYNPELSTHRVMK